MTPPTLPLLFQTKMLKYTSMKTLFVPVSKWLGGSGRRARGLKTPSFPKRCVHEKAEKLDERRA